MGITGWLLVWLIVNALIVAWRILVASTDMDTRDRADHVEPGIEYEAAPARGDMLRPLRVVETPPG